MGFSKVVEYSRLPTPREWYSVVDLNQPLSDYKSPGLTFDLTECVCVCGVSTALFVFGYDYCEANSNIALQSNLAELVDSPINRVRLIRVSHSAL